MLLLCALLTACAGQRPTPPPAAGPPDARFRIEQSLPRSLADRAGWTADIYAAFTVLEIAPSADNICAVAAVIAQESSFRVDPVVPGLPAIAWREINGRAARVGVPPLVVRGVLNLSSPDGRSYRARIDAARTEKDLSDIYEDFIGAVPLGRTLFDNRNPIRTRGPMQVQVAFAEQFAATKLYPYPVKRSIGDELFTRRGGLFFGIAHLLDYPAAYDRYLYRFADFNAGQYASRNAAFQEALAYASGVPLAADGALIAHDGAGVGATELAARTLAGRVDLGERSIREALEQGKKPEFSQTRLYKHVFALAEQKAGRPFMRAALPHIELEGPKITRPLTTQWYANRVEQRFESCLRRGG